MGTMTLKLEINPDTKKKTIVVKYDSDSDATAFEHEQEHKRLIELMLATGVISKEEASTIDVEREGLGSSNQAKQEEQKKQEKVAVKH